MLPGLRQIALRLNDEEARRHPDVESLLFRVEPLLGELARCARDVSMRLAFISTFQPASRTCWMTRASALLTRSSACRAPAGCARSCASSTLLPIGYETLTPTAHVG